MGVEAVLWGGGRGAAGVPVPDNLPYLLGLLHCDNSLLWLDRAPQDLGRKDSEGGSEGMRAGAQRRGAVPGGVLDGPVAADDSSPSYMASRGVADGLCVFLGSSRFRKICGDGRVPGGCPGAYRQRAEAAPVQESLCAPCLCQGGGRDSGTGL